MSMQLATSTIDWRRYQPFLRCDDLATIYPYALRTIRNMAAARNPKIPTPCATRPFLFRRDDVKRHYERQAA